MRPKMTSVCDCCLAKIEDEYYVLKHGIESSSAVQGNTPVAEFSEPDHIFCSKDCVIDFLNDECQPTPEAEVLTQGVLDSN